MLNCSTARLAYSAQWASLVASANEGEAPQPQNTVMANNLSRYDFMTYSLDCGRLTGMPEFIAQSPNRLFLMIHRKDGIGSFLKGIYRR